MAGGVDEGGVAVEATAGGLDAGVQAGLVEVPQVPFGPGGAHLAVGQGDGLRVGGGSRHVTAHLLLQVIDVAGLGGQVVGELVVGEPVEGPVRRIGDVACLGDVAGHDRSDDVAVTAVGVHTVEVV